MTSELLLPMLVHVLWTASLYGVLTVMRAPRIWHIGMGKDGLNPWEKLEPKVSANLSNQFEWPAFFYVVCLLVIPSPQFYSPVLLWLAWVFVAGRIAHTGVQVLSSNIRLRGLVFAINYLAVLAMWGMVVSRFPS